MPWRREWQPTPVFIFAWRIPWREEPGRLQSLEVTESDKIEQVMHTILKKKKILPTIHPLLQSNQAASSFPTVPFFPLQNSWMYFPLMKHLSPKSPVHSTPTHPLDISLNGSLCFIEELPMTPGLGANSLFSAYLLPYTS